MGESRRGTLQQLREAEADVGGKLPLLARVDHALLMAGTDEPASWRAVATLALGTALGRTPS